MRGKTLMIGVVGIVIGVLLSTAVVFAGSLNPSAGPGDPGSQMYTLQQVWDRINNGAAASKMSAFTEPATGPGSTMRTLDELYTLASERSRPAKTGQTTSYATGDDGDLEKGVAWPNPRFTDNGNGTVTDNLTGLMWMKDANAGNDCDGSDTGLEIWANALASAAACNAGAGYAGYTDWRLPNVRELQSLIDYGRFSPALPSGHPFTSVLTNATYYTSTTYRNVSTDAWAIGLADGYSYVWTKTITPAYVWPVRGGQ